MTPCRLKYRYRLFSRDLHFRPGHLYAIYMVSYHEVATSVPDICMPLTRYHITRSPPPSRTPVCHMHDVISRDRHLRLGPLFATYTSYHEISTSFPDTCMPLTRRHITRSPPPSRTPVCHMHDVISRDRHLRLGPLFATYTLSYHEISTSFPDTCMPPTRRHITRSPSPSPSRTLVCHLHDVISLQTRTLINTAVKATDVA